jgi:CRP/FNR family transcriptional regulator, cyclic AMP receptor protein
MQEYVGYVASALVLWTFCARTMLPLRIIALGSNLAFIAYGALLGLYPVLLLHCILLPLNGWRLSQILLLGKRVRNAETNGIFVGLLPFAMRIKLGSGEILLRKGDPSDSLYLLFEGTLCV